MASRRGVLLALIITGCSSSSGVDEGVTPDSLWIRDVPSTRIPPGGVRVRALTLNLHGGQEASPGRVVEVLQDLDLDVIGLEECPAAYADELARALGGRTPLTRVGEEGNVLLSRTPVTSTRAVSLESGRGFVHAETMIDGQPFSLYVAHIGWNAEGSRQARELIDRHLSRDETRRLLVMGDFNDEHLSPQASILEEVLEDAFTASGLYPGQRISWPSTGFDGSEGSQLIDLHYYRRADPPVVVRTEVINAVPVISDHKPTFAELIYPRGEDRFPVGQPPIEGSRTPWTVVDRDEASNLLVNHGAEEGARGWEADNAGEIVTGEREHQAPHGGRSHFSGASFASTDMVSGWSQRVDLSSRSAAIDAGSGWLDAAGWVAVGYRQDVDGEVVASSPRPYDEAEVVVDLEDAGGVRLARWSSGRRDPLQYHPFGARLRIPRGTRTAVMRLWSHRKENSGPSSDAVFDDLYLAHGVGRAHQGEPVAIGRDGEDSAAWGGWKRLADGEPIGIMIYPPRTRSGRGHFAAGVGLDNATAAAEASAAVVPGALRFGGWARTLGATGAVRFALELFEEEGEAAWGRYELEPLQAAEWTLVEGRLRIPPGIVRAVLHVEAEAGDDMVFVDEVVVAQDAERDDVALPD